MNIYLAGTFTTNWRVKVLNEIGTIHNLLMPDKKHSHAIAHYTYHEECLVRNSDCILAYFQDNITTPGTVWEMGIAYTLQKKIVTILENFKLPHETILGISYRVFLDLDYAIEYFKQLKDINNLQHESEIYYRFLR